MGFKSFFKRLSAVFQIGGSRAKKPAQKTTDPPPPAPVQQRPPEPQPPAAATTPAKPKYDPAECTFAKLNNQTVAKRPGQLTPDMPFAIEDCEDSNIFIFTPTAQVTVDNVKRCFIFIAPCDGSVFIRDAQECTFVVACRQFRLRDAKSVRVSLYAATQPVIESSRHIRFSCFRYVYPELEAQFALTRLPILFNEWSNVYDFTATTGQNWTVEPQLDPNLFPPPPPDLNVNPTFAAPNVVPQTLGALPRSTLGSMIFLSFATPPATAEMLRRLRGHITIIRIKERTYLPVDIPLLFGHITDPTILQLVAQKDRVIAAELEGTETNALLLLENSNPPLAEMHAIYFSRSREAAGKELKLFFGG
ncbi:tubulin binding cofactor C-domain-containing protein [Geranomyces variabilis]|nr:tubulin binding cofactor C-domain-containing protein [Geranomyces variabilis]KAJ3138937.1 hypothetical protein HDU90_000842 [Geranomyces variabilis]